VAKAKLEVELVDHVTGRATKAARAAEALLKSERRQQEKLARSQERAHAKLQAEQRKTQERQAKDAEKDRVRGERSYMQAIKLARKEKEQKAKAQAVINARQQRATEQAIKQANREHERKEKLRRQDIINHARGVAKKDRIDQKSADRRVMNRNEGGSLVSGGLAFAGGAALAGVAAVTALGAAAISTSHDFAIMGEKTRFAMEAVSKGKGLPVDSLLKHSDELAVKFGLDLFETRQKFRDLMDLDLNTASIDHFIRLSASMKAAGESAESSEAMMKALAKVKTKGVLDARGLMQLGGAGALRDHVLQALGDELGIEKATEGDLTDALGKKGLAADKALPLIERALLKGVGEEKAGDFAEGYAKNSLEGRENVVKTKGQVVALKAAEANKQGFQDAVTAAENAVGSERTQKAADNAAGFVSDFMSGVTKIGTDLVDIVFSDKGSIEKLAELHHRFLGAGSGLSFDLSAKAAESGSAVDAGLAQGIDDGTLAAEAAARLGDRVVGALDTKLQIHSPSRVLRGRGRFTAEGFSLGLDDGAQAVEASAGSMADAVVPAVSSAVSPGTTKLAGAGGSAGRAPISIGPFTFNGISNSEELAPLVERAVRRGVESMLREEAAKVG
jgi:hypothetical protein